MRRCSSFGVGAARLQADGSILVTWGGQSSPAFTEVDATGATVLTGTFSDASFFYRVVKEPKASFDVAQLPRHRRPVAAPARSMRPKNPHLDPS